MAPPAASMGVITERVAGLMASSSNAIWTKVATVDRVAPATAASRVAGAAAARPAMAPIVAALDTKPETRPASGSP